MIFILIIENIVFLILAIYLYRYIEEDFFGNIDAKISEFHLFNYVNLITCTIKHDFILLFLILINDLLIEESLIFKIINCILTILVGSLIKLIRVAVRIYLKKLENKNSYIVYIVITIRASTEIYKIWRLITIIFFDDIVSSNKNFKIFDHLYFIITFVSMCCIDKQFI